MKEQGYFPLKLDLQESKARFGLLAGGSYSLLNQGLRERNGCAERMFKR